MATADNRLLTDNTGLALVDAIERIAPLQIAPLIISIPTGQWSGSGNDYYITVNASNVTANSILVPTYDKDSGNYLKGPIWCIPAASSFTIHTSAIPSNTVTIMVQFPGTAGEASYQVLADVYSTSQAVAKADIVNDLTSTRTDRPLSAAQGKALNDKITQYGAYSVGQSATLPTGISLYGANRVVILGRICVLQFGFKLESVGSSSKVINNYLPEGARPLFNLTTVGDSGLGDGKAQSMSIGSDGTATIYSVSPNATIYCIGTVTYIM